MAASGPEDVWAAGDYTPSQQSDAQAFVMHWNGSAWSVVPCPSPAGGSHALASASHSPDDAWLIGYYDASPTTKLTFIEHWDGHAWSLTPNPNPAEPAARRPLIKKAYAS